MSYHGQNLCIVIPLKVIPLHRCYNLSFVTKIVIYVSEWNQKVRIILRPPAYESLVGHIAH